MSKKKEKTADVHVRIPKKLYEAIEVHAEKNRRPINSEIVVRLESTFDPDRPAG